VANDSFPKVLLFFFYRQKNWLFWKPIKFSINQLMPLVQNLIILVKWGMADLILRNNIRWDQALLKQIQRYKQDGTVPWLADKNFSAIASAVSLEAGKITFTNKGIIYEIVPYEDIGE